MNTPFSRGMSRATELTKGGKLQEATAQIQSLLNGTPASDAHGSGPEVLEGEVTRLDISHKASDARRPAAKAMRHTLGETLRSIAAGGMPGHVMPSTVVLDLREGAQFLSLSHRSAKGSRDYRLYIPAKRAPAAMPLVVMLHGCTQTPEDFAIGTGMNALAEEFGCIIAYPAQAQGANAQKCWNWFRPEDQGKGRGEPALIAGMIEEILRDHPVDRTRVYAAGLSAGGAAAAILGAAYPDLFAAIGVHSGLPVGSAQDVPQAFAAMRSGATGKGYSVPAPTIVFHGLADTTVHPDNGKAVTAQALRAHSGLSGTHIQDRSRGGRAYRQIRHIAASGLSVAEHWEIEGVGHAWSGGSANGSYTDPTGPDASREMLRFFLQHKQA